MRTILHPLFLVFVLMYVILQITFLMDVSVPALVRNYGADLLCMPIILTIILFLVQKIKRNKNLTLPIGAVLFVVVYWSVYFEYYLPSSKGQYTADLIDVIMYICGAIGFVVWQRSALRKSAKKHTRPEYYR